MNKLTIIGNLTRDPELRTTQNGISVCSFTVAANRRRKAEGQQEADFFRVTAWRELGENCYRYLAKGRKVAVVGAVSVSTYTANDGSTRATMEVTADDVEFLSSRSDEGAAPAAKPAADAPQQTSMQPQGGYEEVDDEDLPF